MSPVPRLQLSGITKQYPAVRANDDVSLTVMPGQIHAVLGENGAGKSTMMKMIFMRVDLPAPFSPSTAWISPGMTVRLTSSLARTAGYCLVMC